MTAISFIKLFQTLSKNFGRYNIKPKIIKKIYPFNIRGGLWGYRPLSYINKIIAHQSLSGGNTESIYRYHISKNSHIKYGIGAPNICYHYTIERDGTIYKVNDLNHIVWHCAGENMHSIGILVIGDFTSGEHVGTSDPSSEQIISFKNLVKHLQHKLSMPKDSIYGHADFGKKSCPGDIIMGVIGDMKRGRFLGNRI